MHCMVKLIICVLLFLLVLYALQGRLIYFPRQYSQEWLNRVSSAVRTIEFASTQGRQRAFYLPPASSSGPKALWVCFNGNASTALDWVEYLTDAGLKETGFLLVDYPGYGISEGSPSPETILESSNLAFKALAVRLGLSEKELSSNLNVLGLSIGTGAALQFAAGHDVHRVVLLAPFTSLFEMARIQIGVPLAYLLKHRFDNMARLAELASRSTPPQVTIFHGDVDRTIPSYMGRELAEKFPSFVTYIEVKECDHNAILIRAKSEIYESLSNSF
jgi:uncharacterized protein